MPSSWHARITRRAISPRFAISTVLNTGDPGRASGPGIDAEEHLPVFHRDGVLDADLGDRALDVALQLVHELHRLDDAERVALAHARAPLDVRGRVGGGRAVERAHHRRLHVD